MLYLQNPAMTVGVFWLHSSSKKVINYTEWEEGEKNPCTCKLVHKPVRRYGFRSVCIQCQNLPDEYIGPFSC